MKYIYIYIYSVLWEIILKSLLSTITIFFFLTKSTLNSEQNFVDFDSYLIILILILINPLVALLLGQILTGPAS